MHVSDPDLPLMLVAGDQAFVDTMNATFATEWWDWPVEYKREFARWWIVSRHRRTIPTTLGAVWN